MMCFYIQNQDDFFFFFCRFLLSALGVLQGSCCGQSLEVAIYGHKGCELFIVRGVISGRDEKVLLFLTVS